MVGVGMAETRLEARKGMRARREKLRIFVVI